MALSDHAKSKINLDTSIESPLYPEIEGTSRWTIFGYEYYKVKPDLICVGKGMGGGMPDMSALAGMTGGGAPSSSGSG